MGRDLVERRRPDRPHEEERRRPQPGHPAAYVLGLQRDMGNQAVQRLLSRPARPILQRFPYIVQAGYMSGDMFGISAALVLNPKAGVVILQEGSETEAAKREPDQSALFKDFYAASLQASGLRPEQIANRIKVVKVNDARAVYKDLLDGGAV